MKEKQNHDTLISDSGIIESNKTRQAHIFVFICNVLTAVLAILGIIVFIKGNM